MGIIGSSWSEDGYGSSDSYNEGYDYGYNAGESSGLESGYKSGWNDAIDLCIKTILKNDKDTSNWKILQKLKKK